MQLAFMALGGWDTHVGQGNGKGGRLAGVLKPLGEGLAVLAQQLGDTWNDTVVMVVSRIRPHRARERRRRHRSRPRQRDVAGGRGCQWRACLWRMAGHRFGAFVPGRDLAVTTDFRTVIRGGAGNGICACPTRRWRKSFPARPARAPAGGAASSGRRASS